MNEVRSRSERYNNSSDNKKKRRLAKWVKVILYLLVFMTIILLYAYFIGAKGLEIKEYTIKDTNLTANFYGLKIVHLSDIHYNKSIKEEDFKNIVDQVNVLKPDIVVITGDLFDEGIDLENDQINSLIKELKRIDASKKYAVTGNNDRKIEKWQKVINESNFINLNDKYDLFYKNSDKPIIISGVSTSYEQGSISHKLDQTNNYLNSLKDDDIKPVYRILLMHEPDFIDDIDKKEFDLVLAGHSHNGQINIPGIKNLGLPKYSRNYYDDYYQVNNTKLYISSGLGTSKLAIRLFCKPSFNLYRFTNK